MTVYVDELLVNPSASPAFAKGAACMTADDLEELHAFAYRLGLGRRRFRNYRRMVYYPLTASQRTSALAAGAVFRSCADERHGVMLQPLDPVVVLDTLRRGVADDDELQQALQRSPAAVARALQPWIAQGKVRRGVGRWIVIDSQTSIG